MALTVKVGELRNRLSAYLRKVRQGVEIVIADRETPIGRLVPFAREKGQESLPLIEPPGGFAGLSKLSFPDIPCSADPVEILLQDRRRR